VDPVRVEPDDEDLALVAGPPSSRHAEGCLVVVDGKLVRRVGLDDEELVRLAP
jgi:hypothetical protein